MNQITADMTKNDVKVIETEINTSSTTPLCSYSAYGPGSLYPTHPIAVSEEPSADNRIYVHEGMPVYYALLNEAIMSRNSSEKQSDITPEMISDLKEAQPEVDTLYANLFRYHSNLLSVQATRRNACTMS